MQRALMIIVAVVGVLVCSVSGQSGSITGNHPFSRKYLYAQLAMDGSDAFFTQQNVCRFGWTHCGDPKLVPEFNPIARPFVQSGSRAQLAGFFAVAAVVHVGSVYMLHRSGHYKMENWMKAINLGGSAAGVAMGARNFVNGR